MHDLKIICYRDHLINQLGFRVPTHVNSALKNYYSSKRNTIFWWYLSLLGSMEAIRSHTSFFFFLMNKKKGLVDMLTASAHLNSDIPIWRGTQLGSNGVYHYSNPQRSDEFLAVPTRRPSPQSHTHFDYIAIYS